jgi:protein required for attachment to host cells
MSSRRWVVVGDSSHCRIFSQEKRFGELRRVDELEHAASRLSDADLVTDRPGRSFDSAGQGRHAMEPRTDPQMEEALRFARRIADTLDRGRVENQFDGVVLMLDPSFLGLLRDNLTRGLRQRVESEIAVNLAQASEDFILAKLKDLYV